MLTPARAAYKARLRGLRYIDEKMPDTMPPLLMRMMPPLMLMSDAARARGRAVLRCWRVRCAGGAQKSAPQRRAKMRVMRVRAARGAHDTMLRRDARA